MSLQTSPESKANERLIRLLRPSVVVLCGPAACGKSAFAERHFRATQIVSSDWARARVCDDDRDQRCNPQAFALVHFLVEQRLTLNRLCVVDSTALTPDARQELLALARKYQVPAILMIFDVPLETCIERDKGRKRSVGKAVVERQHQAFDRTRETLRQEGFDEVIEIPQADADRIRIEILFRPVGKPAQRSPGSERPFVRAGRPHPPRADEKPPAAPASVVPPAQPDKPGPTRPGTRPVTAPPEGTQGTD